MQFFHKVFSAVVPTLPSVGLNSKTNRSIIYAVDPAGRQFLYMNTVRAISKTKNKKAASAVRYTSGRETAVCARRQRPLPGCFGSATLAFPLGLTLDAFLAKASSRGFLSLPTPPPGSSSSARRTPPSAKPSNNSTLSSSAAASSSKLAGATATADTAGPSGRGSTAAKTVP